MRVTLLIVALLLSARGQAQDAASPAPVQHAEQSVAQDSAAYASRYAIALEEAVARLKAQEASVADIERIRARFGDRVAGISVEHAPEYRIIVLLTGSAPAAEETVAAGGLRVPVVYRTGAPVSERAAVLALRVHQQSLRAALPGARGIGFDGRSGALVMLMNDARITALGGTAAIEAKASALTGVPVRLRVADGVDVNLVVGGGARIEGAGDVTGRLGRCTTGFVVGDGTRTGLATAAHCPNDVTYYDPDGGTVSLPLAGSWGARVHDIQVNVSPVPLQPLFYADRPSGSLRLLGSWRNREATRAGDFVCHYGESTGYSCAEVELTHFAPPGALCGGPCEPSWVTVRTASCKGGDSGGPVFLGTTAFGIVKGGNRDRDGGCNFYYYMSVDYLPEKWRLLHAQPSAVLPKAARAR